MRRSFTFGIGVIVLFFACITLAVAGLVIVFRPTPRPIVLGWIYLVVSLFFAGLTAGVWRSVLPGIFACGAINACYMAASGHAVGQSDKGVSIMFALVLAASFIAMAMLTASIAALGRPVDLTDRAGYVALFLSLAVAFTTGRGSALGLTGMIAAANFLVLRQRKADGAGVKPF